MKSDEDVVGVGSLSVVVFGKVDSVLTSASMSLDADAMLVEFGMMLDDATLRFGDVSSESSAGDCSVKTSSSFAGCTTGLVAAVVLTFVVVGGFNV